jgi:serine/threonine-protein kinase HipA
MTSDVHLRYDADWLGSPDRFPISLIMPLGDAPYDAGAILPWVMNLLPEGEPLRAMTRALGASPEDVLGLIIETGSDLAGALSIGTAAPGGPPDLRTIPDDAALERIIADLPARPFLVGEGRRFDESCWSAGTSCRLRYAIITLPSRSTAPLPRIY